MISYRIREVREPCGNQPAECRSSPRYSRMFYLITSQFEDICQQFGSKNLEFGNVNNANPADDEIPFIQPHEIDFIHDLREKAFEVTVACHELLGHGSGQLFVESAPGVYNFDIKIPPQNPVNKQPISSWYKPGETWSNVFGTDANAIEECRADGVALILMAQKPVLEIFGYNNETKPTADDGRSQMMPPIRFYLLTVLLVMYAGWLYFIYGAVKGLASWNPQTSVSFTKAVFENSLTSKIAMGAVAPSGKLLHTSLRL